MSVVSAGSTVPCSLKGCSEHVRLFAPFRGKLSDFKCAMCLPHLMFSSTPSVGSYTNCRNCAAQHLYKGDSFRIFCHVCESKCDKVPKTPEPEPQITVGVCSTCRTTKKVIWTYDPFKAAINSTYVYEWYCDECLLKSSEDI